MTAKVQRQAGVVGTTAIQITGDASAPIEIRNVAGGTIYYNDDPAVASGNSDGNLTAGQAAQFTSTQYIISTTSASYTVAALQSPSYEDISTVDDLTVGDALSVTGITTLTGGVGATATKAAALGPSVYTAALDTTATLSAYGTDAAAADNKTVYLCSLFVPVNCTVTGIATLNGTNITTDKIVNYLFNAAGTMLGQSAAAGTAPTPADTFQETDLTTPLVIQGPAVYFIGRQHDGTTIGFQSIATAKGYRPLAGSVAGTTFGAVTSVTPPTSFTAGKGPFGYLY